MRNLDSYEQAALHLLESPLLISKWEPTGSGIPWEQMKKESRSWSSGEKLVYQLAAHLYNDMNRSPAISDLISTLDDTNWTLVLEALAIRRSGRSHEFPVAEASFRLAVGRFQVDVWPDGSVTVAVQEDGDRLQSSMDSREARRLSEFLVRLLGRADAPPRSWANPRDLEPDDDEAPF